MPLEEIEAVRTDLPGQIEHIIAYAGSTAIAMAGYGLRRGAARIIGCFWVYAGILEYLQNFSPGRNPALVDFAASAFGALCGGVVVLFLWRWRSAPVRPRDITSSLQEPVAQAAARGAGSPLAVGRGTASYAPWPL